ncbi:uncharacterized protein LOC115737366 [Rhodamnia argentea]|uniref:Uncharacterized protein LOC115737366 n=1 Tax=Rhodamnia argentea TaxID=178133 RepID=A0A8B8NS24_9MYRT|nr:uncharacterized protein LOC115737366 [Rhodamnia argentea]
MERNHSKNVASEKTEERLGMRRNFEGGTVIDEGMDGLSQKLQCMTFRTPKRDKNISRRQVQDMEEQARAGWELDFLIEEQLGRFYDCNNRAMNPARLSDVAKMLAPDSTPPLELASVGWFGDWRPSIILGLLQGMARSSLLLSDQGQIERSLMQLIREVRIEEAIIDGEMAEIQATCVLRLPFARQIKGPGGVFELRSVYSEFKKIKQVINKAQQLRFRTLELVAQKILDPTDAASFLVAFEKIRHGLHCLAAEQESRKGPVTVSTRGLRSIYERECGSESPHRSVKSIDKRLLKNARRDCRGRYQTHDDGTALARFIEELQCELQEHCTQSRKV